MCRWKAPDNAPENHQQLVISRAISGLRIDESDLRLLGRPIAVLAGRRHRLMFCEEVRVFVGYDDEGKPVQVSKSIMGGKRDAERLAAQLASRPAPRSGKLTVAELLDEYLEHKGPSWSLSSRRDYASRAERIKTDQIAGRPVSRVSVAEVDRWHLRMHKNGVGEAQIRNLHTLLRAAFSQTVRWELLPTNPVANAKPQRHPKWRLHDLRDWSATHAIAGGHNVRSVAARLGHSDPTTTMRTYAQALEGLDRGIADTFAGVLDGEAKA